MFVRIKSFMSNKIVKKVNAMHKTDTECMLSESRDTQEFGPKHIITWYEL